MSLTLYDITIPVFTRNLEILSRILNKARAFATEKGIAEDELLQARLFEDMGTLIFQVQRMSDTAKFAAVRIGNLETIEMKDEEKTFDDVFARIEKTIGFMNSVDPASMDGRDQAEVELKTSGGVLTYTARDYALNFAVPNFYFHYTTAYDILRHKGVPVGKRDYLGRV